MKTLTVAVLVVAVGVARGMPIEPEPRQFVYQPGSPSVRLYPVHFEHYLKASPGRLPMLKEDSPIMQAFRPNMLQPNMEKTETPSTVGGHMTTPLMPETKPVITTTTTTTTTSTTTTTTVPPSEPKKVPMTTLEPMADMEDETTLQPEPMAEVEADSVPQDQGTTEPIIEDEMMMEDTLAVADDKEEPVSATEIMPMMEGEEETATETFQDENEMVHNTEIQDDMTVTEPEPENEVTTEFPNLRDLPVF